MKKALTIISAPLLLLFLGCSSHRTGYVTSDGFGQGSTYHIVYKIEGDSAQATREKVESLIPVWFEQINKSVSGYDSCSAISRINRNETVVPDSIFIDIFNFAKEFYATSGGMLDAASAPLFDLWGFGFTERDTVTSAGIDSIRQFTGMDMFELHHDSTGYAIIKKDPRAKLNFNAVAQGYSCDYFAERMERLGITEYMIEIGGEIFCKGVNAKGGKWRIGIDKPIDGNLVPGEYLQSVLEVSGKGVVTSGNYRKFYIEDGKKYSHTIDPVTGMPVRHNLLSATVIAENAMLADAYATYFMVLGVEKSKDVLKKTPGIEAMLIYGDNENMEVYMTDGFRNAASDGSKTLSEGAKRQK